MQTTAFPNWFSVYADLFFSRHLLALAGQPGLRFLQVGAYTGDASCWLLDNVLTGHNSTLTDVDTWQGSDEAAHHQFDWLEVEKTYDARTFEAVAEGRLVKVKTTSREFFDSTRGLFDFIYIDGDHTAVGVLEDAVAAVRLLKPGGLLAFDDYLWQSGKGPRQEPGMAIDAIRQIYGDRLILIDIGQQVWFRR